jgi:hypothetical protein
VEKHLLNHRTAKTMRDYYASENVYATSDNGNAALIRSHIAYHCGEKFAQQARISSSRGHSYRVNLYGGRGADDKIVHISDHYDHRDGVHGLVSEVRA